MKSGSYWINTIFSACSNRNMMKLSACVLTSAWLWCAPAHGQEAASTLADRRPVPDLNVMLNDDGDWSFVDSDPEQSRLAIEAAVDALAGTPVKAYLRCIGAGSDTLYYPTKVASVMGWREENGKLTEYIEKVRAGMAAGVDPIRISAERCRAMGIRFFPSVRMNDAHFARTAETHPLTGRFWVEHHDKYTLVSPPNWLDFLHPEVRAYRMDTIKEVIARYGDVMDGIELDFTRHPIFFPRGTGLKHADLLTEMVAEVRRELDRASESAGRPMYLIVRINPTVEACHYSAIDIEQWAERGLIDVMVPARLYDLSYDMDLAGLHAICKSTGVLLYPTLYPRANNTHPFFRAPKETDYAEAVSWVPSIELLRGAIANLRDGGADGFETFNFRVPPGELGFAALRAAADPAAITLQDRIYAVTTGKPSATSNPASQLPAGISPGQARSIRLHVGQDLTDPNAIKPAYVALRLGFESTPPMDELSVRMNGQPLDRGAGGWTRTAVTSGPHEKLNWGPPIPDAYIQIEIRDRQLLRRGTNEIELVWTPKSGGDGEIDPLSLVQVTLGVLYDNPFKHRL